MQWGSPCQTQQVLITGLGGSRFTHQMVLRLRANPWEKRIKLILTHQPSTQWSQMSVNSNL